MSTVNNNPVEEQKAEKKTRSKKPLVALLLAALLGLGAYGGTQLYNESNKNTETQTEKPTPTEEVKEKVTIRVFQTTVKINDQEKSLAEGQTWKDVFSEYFAGKDMSKIEVFFINDDSYGDKDFTAEITKALNESKITFTEMEMKE